MYYPNIPLSLPWSFYKGTLYLIILPFNYFLSFMINITIQKFNISDLFGYRPFSDEIAKLVYGAKLTVTVTLNFRINILQCNV